MPQNDDFKFQEPEPEIHPDDLHDLHAEDPRWVRAMEERDEQRKAHRKRGPVSACATPGDQDGLGVGIDPRRPHSATQSFSGQKKSHNHCVFSVSTFLAIHLYI